MSRAPSGRTSTTTTPPPAGTCGPTHSTPRSASRSAATRPAASWARSATSRPRAPARTAHAATFAAWPPASTSTSDGVSVSWAIAACGRQMTSSSRSPIATTSGASLIARRAAAGQHEPLLGHELAVDAQRVRVEVAPHEAEPRVQAARRVVARDDVEVDRDDVPLARPVQQARHQAPADPAAAHRAVDPDARRPARDAAAARPCRAPGCPGRRAARRPSRPPRRGGRRRRRRARATRRRPSPRPRRA